MASVPKFVGTNNFIYGPFEKEDISLLPINISKILIDKKRARELEIIWKYQKLKKDTVNIVANTQSIEYHK